ncbi:hypothetical protein GWI33_017424 [Rhynchophorus ferrugineus]|uniref:Uncharacterized protein n=1 Tax=Rhynchophorus ferrugineus TaxID=354439 RepID=A0A834HWP8_RHYFE|nr:hypothetical protein GWI33_017424 [Rhynchophorus ferrugineus]
MSPPNINGFQSEEKNNFVVMFHFGEDDLSLNQDIEETKSFLKCPCNTPTNTETLSDDSISVVTVTVEDNDDVVEATEAFAVPDNPEDNMETFKHTSVDIKEDIDGSYLPISLEDDLMDTKEETFQFEAADNSNVRTQPVARSRRRASPPEEDKCIKRYEHILTIVISLIALGCLLFAFLFPSDVPKGNYNFVDY